MKKQITLAFERETKGTLRFQEVDSNGVQPDNYLVGTLYLRKAALDGARPSHLTLTVEDK